MMDPPEHLDNLTLNEQRVWDGFFLGERVDVTVSEDPGNSGRSADSQIRPTASTIRAKVIATLLTIDTAVFAERTDGLPYPIPALRLKGARVIDRLDLSNAVVGFSMEFIACDFEFTPLFKYARTRSLSFTGCELPGVEAEGITVEGKMTLRGCRVAQPRAFKPGADRKGLLKNWAQLRSDRRDEDLADLDNRRGELEREATTMVELASVAREDNPEKASKILNNQHQQAAPQAQALTSPGDDPPAEHEENTEPAKDLTDPDAIRRELVRIERSLKKVDPKAGAQVRRQRAQQVLAALKPISSALATLRAARKPPESYMAALRAELDNESVLLDRVNVLSARITGPLVLNRSTISDDRRTAVNADFAVVEGGIFAMEGTEVIGLFRLGGARVTGDINLSGATLGKRTVQVVAPAEPAAPEESTLKPAAPEEPTLEPAPRPQPETSESMTLLADGLELAGDLICRPDRDRRFTCAGTLSLNGAIISGKVHVAAATLGDYAGHALHTNGITVGDGMHLEGCTVKGTIGIDNAKITGDIAFENLTVCPKQCDDATGTPGELVALRADNITVENGLMLIRACKIFGPVWMRGARIGGTFTLEDTELVSTEAHSVFAADGSTVNGDLRITQSTFRGITVRLADVTVGAQLEISRTAIKRHQDDAPDQDSLIVCRATATALVIGPCVGVTGPIRLDHTVTSQLNLQAEECWLALSLDGLKYDQLTHPTPETDQVKAANKLLKSWGMTSSGYQPQPFEELAAFYRRVGHEPAAKRVLLMKFRQHRKSLPRYRRFAGVVQEVTVGYGFRPWLAGVWLTFLVAAGSLAFALAPATELGKIPGAKESPWQSTALYALDLVLPIISMKQFEDVKLSTGYTAIVMALSLSGWVIATTVVAGLTRVLTRGDR